MLSGFFWLVQRHFPPIGKRPSHIAAIRVASLLYSPLLTSLTMGQKSGLLLLILSATYILLRHTSCCVSSGHFLPVLSLG